MQTIELGWHATLRFALAFVMDERLCAFEHVLSSTTQDPATGTQLDQGQRLDRVCVAT